MSAFHTLLSATFVISRDLGDIAFHNYLLTLKSSLYGPKIRILRLGLGASSVEICLKYTYVRQSTIFQILSPPGIPLKGGLPCAHASTAALAEK